MATKTRDRVRAEARRGWRAASPREVAASQNKTRTGRAHRTSVSDKNSEAQARPLRRVVHRSKRYPDGKCHVCGLPQVRGKVLCEKHERLWRKGEIRLSRAGADRQVEKGNREVTLFLYGKPQEVERPKRRGRPKKKDEK